MKRLLIFLTFFSVIFSFCTRTKKSPIYEKVIDSKKLIIQQCLRNTAVSNYLFYQFTFDDAEPFEVNSLDNENGLPYKSDVYKGSPVVFIDTAVSYCTIDNPEELVEQNAAYLKDPKNNYSDSERVSIKNYIKEDIYKNLKTERHRFLIYLNPKHYSLKEFKGIATAFTKDIKTIDKLLFECKPFTSLRQAYDGWQLCGFVYGNVDDFCEVYTKSKEDYFKILPDGKIKHYNELAIEGKNWISGQDFIYPNIIMPGKTILLKSYTKENLKDYKNNQGKSLADNFNIEQGAK